MPRVGCKLAEARALEAQQELQPEADEAEQTVRAFGEAPPQRTALGKTREQVK